MQTFCLVGSFWAHTHLWQMQRLQCWWLTCWLLTRATPAASYPSCTSCTARPLMHTRYHPWSCCNIPRYAPYAMMGCMPSPLHCLPQGNVYTAAYIFIVQCFHDCAAHKQLFGLNGLHQHGIWWCQCCNLTYYGQAGINIAAGIAPKAIDSRLSCKL